MKPEGAGAYSGFSNRSGIFSICLCQLTDEKPAAYSGKPQKHAKSSVFTVAADGFPHSVSPQTRLVTLE
jgi:hypothetical protein